MSTAIPYRAIRTCRRKKRHADFVSAFTRFIEMGNAGVCGPRLHVYRCEVCDGYHLGNACTKRKSKHELSELAERPVILRLIKRTASSTPEAAHD